MSVLIIRGHVWSSKWKQFRNSIYIVNEQGVIKNAITGDIVKPNHNGLSQTRYLSVRIKNVKYYVHRIVAELYVHNPDPLNKVEVNHEDYNTENNAASNLKWVTSAENKAHSKAKFKRKQTQEEYEKEKEGCPF